MAAVKVIDTLRALGVDELGAGLRHRRDLLSAPPPTLESLASRLCTPHSVFDALDGIDQWSFQVAELLALLPDGAAPDAVATAVGAPVTVADVERALATLRARLLVFTLDGRTRVNPGVRQVFSKPFGLGDPARPLLARRPPQELAAIAARLGVGTGRGATIERVADALADRATVMRVLAGTTANARGVVGGPPLVRLPPLGRWDHVARARALDGPLEWLVGHGLLVVTGWATAEVPREVGLALRGGRPLLDPRPHPPDVATSPSAPVDQVDALAAEQASGTLHDLARLLGVLGQTPAEPLKGAGLGAREIKRLAKAADLDVERAALLLEVALAAELVPVAVRPVAPTAVADEWMAAPPAERWIRLATKWWDTLGLPSLALRKELTVDGKPAPALQQRRVPGERERRHALLACLAELPEGESPRRLADLVDAVTWQLPRSDLGELTEEVTLLTLGEASVLGAIAAGSLSSVGRALVAGDVDGARARAAALLRPPPSEVILQADLTAVVDARVDHEVVSELRLLADLESSGAALVLRFSPASIRRALDTGRSAADIIGFLDAHARSGVPQPLAYLVDDTARRWGRLRSGSAASYLRCDDPALLAEAVRSRSVAALGLRLLAPTVAVAPVPPERVLTALRAAGYLPAREDADGAVVVERPSEARAPAVAAASRAWNEPARSVDPVELARRLLAARAGEAVLPYELIEHALEEPPPGPPRWYDDDDGNPDLDLDVDDVSEDVLAVLDDAAKQGTVVEILTVGDRGRPLALTGQVVSLSSELVVVLTEPRGDIYEIFLEDVMVAAPRQVNRR